jgi:single-strand DNA-binding protein
MNNCNFMGRLTQDAVTKIFEEKEKRVSRFTIAVDRGYVKSGEERKADYFKVVAWNLPQKFIDRWLKKGELIGVIGRMETRTFKGNDEEDVYITELIVEHIYPTNFKKEA